MPKRPPSQTLDAIRQRRRRKLTDNGCRPIGLMHLSEGQIAVLVKKRLLPPGDFTSADIRDAIRALIDRDGEIYDAGEFDLVLARAFERRAAADVERQAYAESAGAGPGYAKGVTT